MPAHIFCVSLDYIVIGCNLSQAKSLGFSHPNELLGLSLDQILSPLAFDQVAKNNDKVVASNTSLVVEEPCELPGMGLRIFLSTKSPFKDSSGKVIGVIGVAQDVTDIKHYEQTALENAYQQLTSFERDANSASELLSEITGVSAVPNTGAPLEYMHKITKYYQDLIALMPGHVYWIDKNGRILGCNNRQAHSFGYRSYQDIVGKHYHDLLPIEEAQILLQINQAVMHNQHVVTQEETGTMENGCVKTYFSTKSPLFSDNGEVIGILGTSLDITKRKQIEDQLRESQKKAEVANQAKTEFLMNMSHDLRTPFSGILGLSQLLRDEELDPQKKAILSDIVTSGKHLLNLLNEIIDYTRVETGEQTGEFHINQDQVDLSALIYEVLGLFAAEVKRKSLQTRVIYSEKLASIFVTDRVMLHRILLNLLSNAVKFTKQGSVSIMVKPSDQSGISIAIHDTGIGMADDDLDKIFDKFSRVTLAHEGFYQGTGLGLSLVQRMVSCMQGTVKVESQLGRGTTFTCLLPIKPLSPNDINHSQENIIIKPSSNIKPILTTIQKTNPRVLVVEDDSISQRVAQYLLESFGCEVSLSTTAEQACSHKMQYFDLILIDLGLPDQSGIVVAEYIKNTISNHLQRPKIAALTAYVDYEFMLQYRQNGFDHVLQKPLTFTDSSEIV